MNSTIKQFAGLSKTFMFNLFKKELVLHCYTADASVYNYAPIQKAANFLPEWWRNLPKTVPDNVGVNRIIPLTTMKYCSGFTGLFSKGIILPLWSDLRILIGERQDPNLPGHDDYHYQFSDLRSEIKSHLEIQYTGIYPTNTYQHLKILSPWHIRCNEDIDFVVIQPTWNLNKQENISVPPATLNFKHQSATHVNIFWRREEGKKLHDIPFGQPLLHLIPLSERKIRLQHHLVSVEELNRIISVNTSTSFINKYKKNINMIKKRNCPYKYDVEK